MENFWQQLRKKKDFLLGLSPMDGVTDYPFRKMIKDYGKADLIFTEFANVEGICHGATGILRHFDFDRSQKPLIVQIFGKDPESFYQTAILLADLGVTGIDINMGCPAKTVANHGSGAALIKTPELAEKIIDAVKQGVLDWREGKNPQDCPLLEKKILEEIQLRQEKMGLYSRKKGERIIPAISVKTRIGFAKNEVAAWLPRLLQKDLSAIIIHGRTLKQAYAGLADWSAIAEVVALRNRENPQTLILGNGDVKNYEEAEERVKDYGVDGVLIGRASMGNPYIFLPAEERVVAETRKSLLVLAMEHAQFYQDSYSWEENYAFLPMRKHLACYSKGIKEAKKLRLELVRTKSAEEVKEILKKYQLL